jgi:deoxyribose-phosphate aldolase
MFESRLSMERPMRLTPGDLARMIDISAVRAQHGEQEIRELVRVAKTHRFVAVHVLPCWVPFVKDLLRGEDDILVGAPVGFPGGGHHSSTKAFEAAKLVEDGVREMDMMINIGKLRSGAIREVEDDIRGVVEAAGTIPVKVILEVPYLTPTEVEAGCACAITAGAEYVKTSTGWVADGSPQEVVRAITAYVGDRIKVKAAGGIRDLDTLLEMLGMGVSRFGINLEASIRILDECARRPGGAAEL